MVMRTKLPRIGERVTVRHASPYDLPSGLQERQSVTVIADGNAGVTVEDDTGQRFRIAIQCCDTDAEYLHNGQWVPENHPEVIRSMIASIVELETTRSRWPAGIGPACESNLERWRAALRRHMTADWA
jgi:hypothetical protein